MTVKSWPLRPPPRIYREKIMKFAALSHRLKIPRTSLRRLRVQSEGGEAAEGAARTKPRAEPRTFAAFDPAERDRDRERPHRRDRRPTRCFRVVGRRLSKPTSSYFRLRTRDGAVRAHGTRCRSSSSSDRGLVPSGASTQARPFAANQRLVRQRGR